MSINFLVDYTCGRQRLRYGYQPLLNEKGFFTWGGVLGKTTAPFFLLSNICKRVVLQTFFCVYWARVVSVQTFILSSQDRKGAETVLTTRVRVVTWPSRAERHLCRPSSRLWCDTAGLHSKGGAVSDGGVCTTPAALNRQVWVRRRRQQAQSRLRFTKDGLGCRHSEECTGVDARQTTLHQSDTLRGPTAASCTSGPPATKESQLRCFIFSEAAFTPTCSPP